MEDYTEQLKKNRQELIKSFFVSLKFMRHLSTPIRWEEAVEHEKLNVLVIGNIGQGKSTLLNKLYHFILHKGFNEEFKNQSENSVVSEPFLAKKSSKAITKDLECRQVE